MAVIRMLLERRYHGQIPTPAIIMLMCFRILFDGYSLVIGSLVLVFRSSKLWPGLRLLIIGMLVITFHLIPLFWPFRYVGYDNLLDSNPAAVSNLFAGVILYGLVVELGFVFLVFQTVRNWSGTRQPPDTVNGPERRNRVLGG